MGESLRLQVPVPRRGARGSRWRAAGPRARGVSRDEQTDSRVQSNPDSDSESPAQLRGLRGGSERRLRIATAKQTPRVRRAIGFRGVGDVGNGCETAAP